MREDYDVIQANKPAAWRESAVDHSGSTDESAGVSQLSFSLLPPFLCLSLSFSCFAASSFLIIRAARQEKMFYSGKRNSHAPVSLPVSSDGLF